VLSLFTAAGACAGASGDDVGIDATLELHPADAAVDAPPGTLDGPPDADLSVPCASGALCSGASTLGDIRGDEGNDQQTVQGYQSAWYKITVREASSAIGVPVRVKATLTNPEDATFDVFISEPVCAANPIGTHTVSGNVRETKAEFGDTFIADDSKTVSIEVRPLSGVCSVGQVWQLVVEGNWQ
jgi:hypothetical protein